MVRFQELLALPEEELKQQLQVIPLTYIQYKLLKNDDIREWYVNNSNNLTMEFSIPYIRDNKNPNNLIRFIKEGKFEVVNNVDDFVECCKQNNIQIKDSSYCIQLIYRSYVQRMLNSTTTNWSLNSYVKLINYLTPNDNINLWDDATSQVLYKTNEILEFNFDNRKFYINYVQPHLHELILPTQLEKILPCMNVNDKLFIKNEVKKKKNHFLGYYNKKEIIDLLE
jgi:hypothetical protein